MELVSIQDLAAMAGVSLRTLRRRQAAGEMPPRIQRCRSLMYRRSDAEAWIERTKPERSDNRGRSA
ncbi:helix-turn-helix transcriptional regulator [Mesorhizobium jarvisii]